MSELTPEMARKAMRGDEIALTLKASDGYWPHTVRDAAKVLTHLDRLLRELGKGMVPPVKVEPLLVRVDILNESLKFTIRVANPRPRKRATAGRTAAPAERDAGQAESKGDSSATETDLGS